MIHPEVPYLPVGGCQGEAGLRHRVAEVRFIEIQTDAQFSGPAHPGGEMLGGKGVPIDLPAAGLRVDGMDIRAVLSGNQRERLFVIRAQLLRGPRLAGVVAGGLDASAGKTCRVLEPPTSSACQQCRESGTDARIE